jgi:prophage antirepressor-like protein
LESAIYDEKSKMLKGYLNGLSAHLSEQGEGWLILSDFAEQLGLRSREELLGWISDAGLQVLEKIDTKARHNKVLDASDPLHEARKAELTSLWRLAKA